MSVTILKMKINQDILKRLSIRLMTGDCKLTTAFTAAACTNCTAVVTRERFAAFVAFRWREPSLPPTQNVNSALFSLVPARQFSENYAIYATVATFTTLGDPNPCR